MDMTVVSGPRRYVLLCGYPPFWGDTDKKVLQKALSVVSQELVMAKPRNLAQVSKGSFSFNPADWKSVAWPHLMQGNHGYMRGSQEKIQKHSNT